jgi:hypothetical protein
MKIYLFPPNASNVLQLLVQGIINDFKAHYTNLVINKLPNSVEHENGNENAY